MSFFKKNNTFTKEQQNRSNADLLSRELTINISTIKEVFGQTSDLIIRNTHLHFYEKVNLAIIYIEGLVDTAVQESVLNSMLMDHERTFAEKGNDQSAEQVVDFLINRILTVSQVVEVSDVTEVKTQLLSGNTLFFLDGHSKGFAVHTKGWKGRNIDEPESQTVVRGPREAFTENIETSITQIRKRIKDSSLIVESTQVGRITHTDVAIMYLKGIANEKALKEVRERLDKIDVDGILESGNIEEFIQDTTYSPFPTVFSTERADVIAGGLLEGRIAIFVDGTPFVLLVPALFIQFYQVSEDYYQRADISSLLRMLRLFCFIIALFGPALYIGITTYHMEMLPTSLLISLAAQREGIPFPALIEALMMEVAFEILREAGVRMPRTVGQAVSIVGALVIGEAAIMAGIVSPSMVIVVSITAIASFVIPSYNMAISLRILRFIFMMLAASFGLLGITVGIFALVLHLSSLKSFGVPYMTPFGPFVLKDQKDTIFRLPQWGLLNRPSLIAQHNTTRVDNKKSQKH
ncbi:spore germination protein [Fictibacillus nanhaiensis]|uniref:spore germination protein n=1 Tax=Fictibacillus nanhaiensis TaxID=742169 RepID=UPI001C95B28B|nr:spore germination protein [Fictibacillus nanhaiensis]MBY6037701.1 spore germination protein [Fictibacillus nanhaiensis]